MTWHNATSECEVEHGYCHLGVLDDDVLGRRNGLRFDDDHPVFLERALAALAAQGRISIRLPP